MASISSIRERLSSRYRRSLAARAEALDALLIQVARGDHEALDSVYRIAHQLRGSGASFGFVDISELAGLVELAQPEQVHPRAVKLVGLLRQHQQQLSAPARILIVEDDEVLAEHLRLVLSAGGHLVTVCHSYAAARSALDVDVDVLLLDLALPDRDGRDLLVEVERHPAVCQTAVVVLTAKTSSETRAECMALGATACLTKPVEERLLCTTVEAIVARTRQATSERRVDPLTQLPNRLGCHEAFERAHAATRRAGRSLTLALIDIDHFKLVNDRYGHAVGDRALSRLAEVLRDRLRASDIAARWGGEEFVIILPETTTAHARIAIDAVRDALRAGSTDGDDGPLPGLTLSGGVVSVEPDDDLDNVLARADELLYRAKRAGRDRIFDCGNTRPERPRVLLVGGDDLRSDDLASRLTDLGLAHTHHGSLAALQSDTRVGAYAAAVITQQLTDGDGLALVRSLRSDPSSRDLPVVVVIQAGDDEALEAAFASGAADCVAHPPRPRELSARLLRLLA